MHAKVSIWQTDLLLIHRDIDETCKADEENEAPKGKKDYYGGWHVVSDSAPALPVLAA